MSLTNAYIISTNKDTRKKNDYYPTPPIATWALMDKFDDVIPKEIWEPAAGRGWISRELADKYDRVVTSTDLHSYKNSLIKVYTGLDYLNTEMKISAVITNPPYKHGLAEAFVRKAIKESEFVAMFLRLTFMEGKGRYQLFNDYPPNVNVFSSRMNCDEDQFDTIKGQSGGMVAYAWFVWGKNVEPGKISWLYPQYEEIDKFEKFYVQ